MRCIFIDTSHIEKEYTLNGTKILMHKNDKVCECKFDSRGYLENITNIFSEKLLPMGVGEENPVIELQKWILNRSISQNRRDIGNLREFYGSPAFIPEMALSLFDCYWFSEKGEPIWDEVNAFDNWDCRRDSIYLMLARPEELEHIDKDSPNLTVPGREPRIWYRLNDSEIMTNSAIEESRELCLLYGNPQTQMDNYKKTSDNPIVAKRTYCILHNNIYVKVSAFTSKDIEMVCFDSLYNNVYNKEKSKMENLTHCCEYYCIPNWKSFFANLIKYDEAIGNKDRELSDIYVLRNSDTLEIIGFAPL